MGRSATVTVSGGVRGFPAALTSFIGREGPLRAVARLLGQHRLVTVTGPGGSGKTRLADQVARRAAARFADGACLVELAPVQDEAQVAAVVAAALGVRDQPGVPTAEAVARVLTRQQLLLILDNCEHVIGAAAHLCAGLLTACDDVRILATSREPLAVAGEARYRLGPMTLPGPGDRADAGHCEAVALFTDRARSADAHFTLDDRTGADVARLVTRLDGMPLAIELAAARVEALGIGQLLDRLNDRFTLLAVGDRLAPPRHRSLWATVEWSYQLLDDQEQRVFRAMSVFPGPFTLEAAEAVTGEAAGPTVLRLVDCSLLTPPRAGPDGRARYAMLETLRAYGTERLVEAGEKDAVDAAMTRYMVKVAEGAAAGLASRTGEVNAARWLDAEDVTTRQALAWAVENDVEAALRLIAALGWWWFLRGRAAGEYPLMCRAAERAAPGGDSWCAAQFFVGWTAHLSRDPATALGHFTTLQDAVADRPPSRALTVALAGQAASLMRMGRLDEAVAEGRRAVAMARKIVYPVGEAVALAQLSIAVSDSGDHQAAVQLARQAEQIQAGIPRALTRVSADILTLVLIASGDLAAAERVCTIALDRCRDAGDQWNLIGLLPDMAFLDVQAGRPEDAAVHLREALQIAVRTGRSLSESLDCCGHLCAATGRCAEALTVWAAYAALRREGSAEPLAYVRRRQDPLRRARAALGAAGTRAAEERGAAMTLNTAADYALLLTEGHGQRQASAPRGNLSPRERELVTLVAQGATNAQIAAQLYISVRTVSSHLDRIRDKTGCRRRADLTRLALTAHLV